MGKGYLKTTCIKEETSNDLVTKITYILDYKENVVSDVEILYEYQSSDINVISALKLSTESQNQYFDYSGLKITTIKDEINDYVIKYNIVVNDVPESILTNFKVTSDKIKLVKDIKEDGFKCD